MNFKNIARWTLKFISAVITFLLIFIPVQSFFVPENDQDKTVKSLYYLPENSVDVLFMGSSQLFCSIDAQRMTDKHKISACDFSAGSQNLITTVYYLEEALKKQQPKVVVVEVCSIFSDNKDSATLSCNYHPMPMSVSKFDSLNYLLSGDKTEAFKYTYSPLLLCHDRWKSVSLSDIKTFVSNEDIFKDNLRGFYPRNTNEVNISFLSDKKEHEKVSDRNDKAISEIKKICSDNGIKLLFFKSPSGGWTKEQSDVTKAYMQKNGNDFIDFNDFITEIGIDTKTDFNNKTHLSVQGAEKTTDYMSTLLAGYIK